jgi:predicted nucleotidyltransferase
MRAELTRILESCEQVEFAYLFGSRSHGNARSDSDWDVAVYVSEALTCAERADLRLALLAQLPASAVVDLIVINDAPPLLAHRALQGTKLFVRDRDLFARVFVRVLGESMDEAPWRELHRNARTKRLEEGRFGRP